MKPTYEELLKIFNEMFEFSNFTYQMLWKLDKTDRQKKNLLNEYFHKMKDHAEKALKQGEEKDWFNPHTDMLYCSLDCGISDGCNRGDLFDIDKNNLQEIEVGRLRKKHGDQCPVCNSTFNHIQ